MAVAVLVMIFHAENRARESEDFAESHKHGVVYFAGWRHDESGNEQSTAYGDKDYCRNEGYRGLMSRKFCHNVLVMWWIMRIFASVSETILKMTRTPLPQVKPC